MLLCSSVLAGFLSPDIEDNQYLDSLIYQQLPASGVCVRLLSQDGPFGCSSSSSGDVGALVLIENFTDPVGWLASVKAEDFAPLIAIVPYRAFGSSLMDMLAATELVVGVVVVLPQSVADAAPSSPVSPSPNSPWSGDSVAWNPSGTGDAFRSMPLSVVALDHSVFVEAGLCEKARLNLQPSADKWAMQIDAWMWAVGDAALCLSRGHCDPLGGQSVYHAFNPRNDSALPSVVVSTRLDSYAFFQQLSRGSDSAISGTAALIAAIELLYRVAPAVPLDSWRQQLVFAFFTGESWGYLGSKRFVADLKGFHCSKYSASNPDACTQPSKYSLAFQQLDFEAISLLVDLQQVGILSDALYLHAVNAASHPSAQLFLETLANSTSSSSPSSFQFLRRDTIASRLPPSSTFPFLDGAPGLPAVVITDHEAEFVNPHYQSDLESAPEQIDVGQMCRLATLLTRSLLMTAAGLQDSDPLVRDLPSANCTLVAEVVHCLLVSPSCELVKRLIDPDVAPGLPPQPTYTSVFRGTSSIGFINKLVHAVVFDISQHLVDLQGATCDPQVNCKASEGAACASASWCQQSPTFFHDAFSPAFQYDDDAGRWVIVNASEPTFVESAWEYLGVKIFVRSSFWSRITLLGFGIFQLLLAFLAVHYWQDRYQTI